jgi:glutathione peroxidase
MRMNVYEFAFQSISGASMPLGNWTGQPLLLVNTASECGYTPQYGKLQRIYDDYRQSGLVVIGMPCNDFGEQEPGDEEEIARFTWENYRVTFPLTRKIQVIGLGAHPLFTALVETYGDDVIPRWNFHKYLFDNRGELVEHWPSRVEPDDPALTHQVERNLQSWIL